MHYVSVDLVIFGFDSLRLKVLLVHRQSPGFTTSRYTLPGDLVEANRDLDDTSRNVLHDATGLSDIYLEQFHTFGGLHRLAKEEDRRWMREHNQADISRVITVGYYSLINVNHHELKPGSFAKDASWVDLAELPDLAFDHNQLIDHALHSLRRRLQLEPIGFELLPERFTLRELQTLYEAILGTEMDKRNFRKKIQKHDYLIPLNEKEKGVAHKPAQFFRFDKARYEAERGQHSYFRF